MKKLFLLFGLLVSALNLSAQCTFYIEDKTVRPGEVSYVTLMYDLEEGYTSTGYTFYVKISEGLTPYMTPDPANEGGTIIESYNGDGCEGWNLATNFKDGEYRFLAFSFGAGSLPAGKHAMLVFPVKVDDDVAPGTELKIESVQCDLALTSADGGTNTFHPAAFSATYTVVDKDDEPGGDEPGGDEPGGDVTGPVKMYDNYASFDEFPQAEGNVDVRVYRTLKAGKWSTIVVPFDMDARRINSAFGDGVKISDFVGWETEKEGTTVKKINLKFEEVETMKANTPYIIKVAKDVTNYFYANSVTVEPEEYPTKAVSQKDGRLTVNSYFYGTYFKDVIPTNNLFIQDNLFYYSTGKTNIKGFRGFFEIYQASASAKIGILVDNEEVTSIEGLQINSKEVVDGDIYSISGQYLGKDVDRLHRGVYIVNGKKYVKK